MNKFSVLGVKISDASVDEIQEFVLKKCKNNEKVFLLSGNVHSLNIALTIPWFSEFISSSSLVICDGIGPIIGARILGYRFKNPRLTFADWIYSLSEFCAKKGLSLFFLGAKPGIAKKARERMKSMYPDLEVVGTHHGYFKKSGEENEKVIELINQVKPNLLIVGFGMPLQEKWLIENYKKIDANVFLTGGACFDYASGTLRRGPKWMTDHGLEWLARLIIEPRRLLKRYLIGNIVFLIRILKESGFLFRITRP